MPTPARISPINRSPHLGSPWFTRGVELLSEQTSDNVYITGGYINATVLGLPNVLTYGAVADGVDTGSAFTGTDNTTAFQAAMAAASATGSPLYIPPGVYRFAGVTTADTAVLTAPTYCWLVGHGATLLIDENTSVSAANRDFIRSTGWQTTNLRTALELFCVEGVTFKGRWTHGALASVGEFGISFLALANYKEVHLDNIKAFDCRGKFSRSSLNNIVTVINSRFERMTSDCLRFVDSNNVLIDGNFFQDSADNCIALHSNPKVSGFPYTQRPTRSHLVITNNRMVGVVTPLVLGAHSVVFANNVLQRCGGSLSIGLEADPEGVNPQANIIIANNIVEDAIQRYISGAFAVQTRSDGAMTIGGAAITDDTSAVFPGEYDAGSTSVLDPWGEANAADPLWGYMWTGNNQTIAGVTTESAAGSFNIVVKGNVVSRTLPAVAAYSDWGFGETFTATGYEDPAVADTTFRYSALVVYSDVRNCLIEGNVIFGFRNGGAVYLGNPGIEQLSDIMFRGMVVRGNVIVDCLLGITSERAGSNATKLNAELTIDGNHFDIDPYHKSSFRTSPINGSWPSSGASGNFPSGICINGYQGWIIRNNTFANLYMPIAGSLTVALAQAHVENNLCMCDPAAVGYSASNKGIASVPEAGPAFRFMIVNSDPTSVDWRKLKNTCPLVAAAMPASGTWVSGQFVANSAPAVAAGKVLLGWARLTTGTGHVDGTDWSPLYCAVS